MITEKEVYSALKNPAVLRVLKIILNKEMGIGIRDISRGYGLDTQQIYYALRILKQICFVEKIGKSPAFWIIIKSKRYQIKNLLKKINNVDIRKFRFHNLMFKTDFNEKHRQYSKVIEQFKAADVFVPRIGSNHKREFDWRYKNCSVTFDLKSQTIMVYVGNVFATSKEEAEKLSIDILNDIYSRIEKMFMNTIEIKCCSYNCREVHIGYTSPNFYFLKLVGVLNIVEKYAKKESIKIDYSLRKHIGKAVPELEVEALEEFDKLKEFINKWGL